MGVVLVACTARPCLHHHPLLPSSIEHHHHQPPLTLLSTAIATPSPPHRLEEAGYGVGHRLLELLAFRERQYRRESKLIGVLQFVSSTVWKALFNKVADSLERSTEAK
jgi:hypothetical protein